MRKSIAPSHISAPPPVIDEGLACRLHPSDLWYAADPMTNPTTDDAKPGLMNVEDMPWEPYSHGGFGGEDRDLTAHVRARKLDVSMTRLAPGQVSCPYHFHHAE